MEDVTGFNEKSLALLRAEVLYTPNFPGFNPVTIEGQAGEVIGGIVDSKKAETPRFNIFPKCGNNPALIRGLKTFQDAPSKPKTITLAMQIATL